MAVWSLILWATLAAAPMPANEIVAVVEGAPITLWDIDVEVRLRALEQRGVMTDGEITDSERRQSLQNLINQQLALRAADRYNVSPPGEREVEDDLLDLRSRALVNVDDQLRRAGIPAGRLEFRVRAKLRIRRLIRERLKELVRVGDDEVLRYQREHQQAATSPSDIVREYLATLKLNERSRSFFKDLRDRASVILLDPRFDTD